MVKKNCKVKSGSRDVISDTMDVVATRDSAGVGA